MRPLPRALLWIAVLAALAGSVREFAKLQQWRLRERRRRASD